MSLISKSKRTCERKPNTINTNSTHYVYFIEFRTVWRGCNFIGVFYCFHLFITYLSPTFLSAPNTHEVNPSRFPVQLSVSLLSFYLYNKLWHKCHTVYKFIFPNLAMFNYVVASFKGNKLKNNLEKLKGMDNCNNSSFIFSNKIIFRHFHGYNHQGKYPNFDVIQVSPRRLFLTLGEDVPVVTKGFVHQGRLYSSAPPPNSILLSVFSFR